MRFDIAFSRHQADEYLACPRVTTRLLSLRHASGRCARVVRRFQSPVCTLHTLDADVCADCKPDKNLCRSVVVSGVHQEARHHTAAAHPLPGRPRLDTPPPGTCQPAKWAARPIRTVARRHIRASRPRVQCPRQRTAACRSTAVRSTAHRRRGQASRRPRISSRGRPGSRSRRRRRACTRRARR